MDDLSNTIYAYYLSHFDELAFDKQFHFASRLYLWDRDESARTKLDHLRDEFTASGDPTAALQAVYNAAQQSPIHGSKNAAELRRPHFEKYPKLKTYVTLLFRLNFLQTIYGLDARQAFHQLCPQAELEAYVEQLLQDDDALAILSTHAVNFLYLYQRVVLGQETDGLAQRFLEVGQQKYDLSNTIHLQLFIYLYTHYVIGETQFYYRRITKTGVYLEMMQQLEALIDTNFERINMDNKFEFLACSRLVGRESFLTERIWDEAKHSVSPDGSFIIDRHNQNPQQGNVDLNGSEHRNVLLLLANRPFKPLA
ncbi:hypothetical protein KDA23_03675 [Candidatus Saccharibacteria bacterium]|nr:hypothetical protein [Candidatus Saccharibacteria bacterium]